MKHIILLDDDYLNSFFVKTHLRRFFRKTPFNFTYISKPSEFIEFLRFMCEQNIEPDIILIDFYLKGFNVEVILDKLNNEFRRFKDVSYLFTSAEKAKEYTFKVLDKSQVGHLNSLLMV